MRENATTPPEDSAIRDRAYELWNEAGQPEGRTDEFWHQAREELAAASRSGSLDDQLEDSFPASDPASMTDPSIGVQSLPTAPEDEAAPAKSATLEERPAMPPKPATAAVKPPAAPAKPKAKPVPVPGKAKR